jgi:hypothetical protein
MQHDGGWMNPGDCEVRQMLREAVSAKAKTLFEMRARTSISAALKDRHMPIRARVELADAIEAYRRALREFEWHIGEHRCE